MKVLFLGPPDSPLLGCLEERDQVIVTGGPLDPGWLARLEPDVTVSYGYRHILRGEVLARLEGRAVNLHISFLPWNRGADPNLWSVLEGTPAGVSIHYIDAGVDTGDLIAQRRVELAADDTLGSSYARLQAEVQALFREIWPSIRKGDAPRVRQASGGSYHAAADKARVEHLLSAGWDTPIAALAGACLERERPRD